MLLKHAGDITGFAKAAHTPRQNIYRMLSAEGNPTFDNLTSIFDAMGVKMQLSLKAS